MPTITAETPRDTITIASETFTIPQPYVAGHALTANEASAFNQLFAENIRNNMASRAKTLKEADSYDHDVFQGAVDDYTAEYEFGVRTGGGGRSGDPIQVEAMNIARDLVRQAISKAGKVKVSDVPAKKISELAREAIDSGKYPQILETAKARVEAAKDIGVLDLGELDTSTPAAAEGETETGSEEPVVTGGRKAKGESSPTTTDGTDRAE